MSYSDHDSPNPYQPPVEAHLVNEFDTAVPQYFHELLKKFRSQMHALGGFWIVIGGVVVALIGMVLGGTNDLDKLLNLNTLGRAIVLTTGALGIVWVLLGILTCLKQIWAVYVGLVLSYLSIIGNILNLNICALIVLIVVILQAHRVIAWSRRLQTAGIPLNTKPPR